MSDVREGGDPKKGITFKGKGATVTKLVGNLKALTKVIQKFPNTNGSMRFDELQANLQAMATALKASPSPSVIMQEATKLLVETLLEVNSLLSGHQQKLAEFFPDDAWEKLSPRYYEEMEPPGGFS